MDEEMTGKCLRQVEHIRGQLWHRYFIKINQIMVAAATLYQGNPDRNRKLWNSEYTEIYTPYAGAVGMLLHINGKSTMGKLK